MILDFRENYINTGASDTANFYVLTEIATTNTTTWCDNKHSVWQKNTVVVKTCICAPWTFTTVTVPNDKCRLLSAHVAITHSSRPPTRVAVS